MVGSDLPSGLLRERNEMACAGIKQIDRRPGEQREADGERYFETGTAGAELNRDSAAQPARQQRGSEQTRARHHVERGADCEQEPDRRRCGDGNTQAREGVDDRLWARELSEESQRANRAR